MEKGFTLTEILVYIAVLSIIVLALSSFFLWASRFNVKTKITREVFDNMRRTMEALTSEIRGQTVFILPPRSLLPVVVNCLWKQRSTFRTGKPQVMLIFIFAKTVSVLKRRGRYQPL